MNLNSKQFKCSNVFFALKLSLIAIPKPVIKSVKNIVFNIIKIFYATAILAILINNSKYYFDVS